MSKSNIPEVVRSTSHKDPDYPLTLAVAMDGASDEELADVTQDLKAWIGNAAPECKVTRVTEPGKPGSKGLFTVLSKLGLELFEPSALKGLVNCLAVYIKERRKELVITVTAPDGRKFQMRAGGIDHDELKMLAGLAQGFATPASGASRV